MTLKQQQKHQRLRAAQDPARTSLPAGVMASRVAFALQSHQAGDLPAAEAVYREVLRLHPSHADALHYLGMIHYQRRQLAEAAELMARSILHKQTQGGSAAFHSNFGLVLHDLGKLEEAEAAFAQALRMEPDYPEALNNLGNTLQAWGKLDEALARYRRALDLQPGYVQAYCNAGSVLKKRERFAEAEEMYRTALHLSPKHAEAHYNLANTLYESDRLDEAVAHYGLALAECPDHPKAHVNWGNVLVDQGGMEEAVARYETALGLAPGASGMAEESRTAGPPNGIEGVPPSADSVVAHMNLAMARLLLGDFASGLPRYEWRHHSASPSRAGSYPQPMWRGEPLDGKTILLHWEQGLGDTLHLLRYAPMVRARGGRVVLHVQPCLERLARSMGREYCVTTEEKALPPFDLHCPLMSLPFAFGTCLDTIPHEVPYLRVPDEEMAYAATLPWTPGLKVGVVWAGSPNHAKDKLRSLKLNQLASLLEIPGVQFYSLQVGPAAEQLSGFPAVRNLAPDPGNMADTAAKLARLDLLIAADTAVAHLAGALGKPVWVMLPHTPDWRWLRDRGDSPWYPTMRLFRQPARHDWASVVDRIGVALRERMSGIGYPEPDAPIS